MLPIINDLENERLVSRILTMYYLEDHNQAEIGDELGISAAKVNRLLKQARNAGWVEFMIHTPSQQLFDLEQLVQKTTGIRTAVIIPRISENPDVILSMIGQAAARYLLQQLRDGDVICNGGGRGLAAMVQALDPSGKHTVKVVPALGGVQGRFDTDVNKLAGELAKRLGGESLQLYAPAFTDKPEEQVALTNLRHVREVLDLARMAQVAVVGVGSIHPQSSSFMQFTGLSAQDLQDIIDKEGGVGEILARVFDSNGKICAEAYASRVIGLELDALKAVPLSIGIAVLDNKARSIAAALKGGYLKTIVMDDVTAKEVLAIYQAG